MRVAQLKQQIDEGITLHGDLDRDLHSWWSKFNASYATLDSAMNKETACEQRDLNKQQIDHLTDLVKKVKHKYFTNTNIFMVWQLQILHISFKRYGLPGS